MANEKRLIDANALDSKLEALAKKYAEQGRMEAAKDYSFVQTVLLTAPTVDAVEVVRCKDCVHAFVRYGENECYCGHPDGLNDRLRPGDFCSYGERREGECPKR